MLVYYITIFVVMLAALYAESQYRIAHNDMQSIGKLSAYNLGVCLTAVVLIGVAGLRWKVGTDYGNYMLSYARRKSAWLISVVTFDEPGIGILAKLGSLFFDDYAVMFFLVSLVTIGLYIWSISKCTDYFAFSVMLYIFAGCWHNSFNGIRQYAAAAIIFAGHKCIYRKQFKKYLLVIILAMLFHKTACVMLPVYFIANKKINIKTISVLLLGSFIIRYSYDYLFDVVSFMKGSEQRGYAYMQSDVNIWRIAVAIAPLILSGVIYMKTKPNQETEFYVCMAIINAVFMLGTAGSAYLARVGIYTEAFLTLYYPNMIKFFHKDSKKLFIIIVLFFYAMYWYHEVSVRDSLNNFQWIFNRIGN